MLFLVLDFCNVCCEFSDESCDRSVCLCQIWRQSGGSSRHHHCSAGYSLCSAGGPRVSAGKNEIIIFGFSYLLGAGRSVRCKISWVCVCFILVRYVHLVCSLRWKWRFVLSLSLWGRSARTPQFCSSVSQSSFRIFRRPDSIPAFSSIWDRYVCEFKSSHCLFELKRFKPCFFFR